MPIINVEIMKAIDERERCNIRCVLIRWSNSKVWFCCALSFLQLICKASLIFKSNLEFTLSNILNERELHESKHVVVECRCLKIRDLLSFLICSSILVFKWRQVSPIWLEIQLAQVNFSTKKGFKSSGIGSYRK